MTQETQRYFRVMFAKEYFCTTIAKTKWQAIDQIVNKNNLPRHLISARLINK
jgi:hypothetical protein